jgi:hypothetical protein
VPQRRIGHQQVQDRAHAGEGDDREDPGQSRARRARVMASEMQNALIGAKASAAHSAE